MSRTNRFIGRRNFIKLGGGAIVALSSPLMQVPTAFAQQLNFQPISPALALQELIEGNQRFVQDKRRNPHQSRLRLAEIATVQHPFASILSCADSRVPAEMIFDAGLGDLFVVRIAGNVVSPRVMGSLEYATKILGSQLIVILGHERCGAVTAAVEGTLLEGEIGTFVADIKPALARIKDMEGDRIDNAVIANVQYQLEVLNKSKLLTDLVTQGKLQIIGGRYDLDTGEVTII
ncbi:carbonic anhydrase [Synechocystis sp. PCC 7509]|uniref:carbonic anhydrase n=1 Tax=Synechocystis sp. PCC 7509 TaxID=927677 RepID=UPI0002AC6F30|nr:carbonic anhydrase [Synechocystis sp. PCC 7509]